MSSGDYGIRHHTRKALELCAYLHWFDGADIHELVKQTGTSIPTVKRLIRHLREELRVRIVWHRDRGDGGGAYRLHDWGYLDSVRVLADYRPLPGMGA